MMMKYLESERVQILIGNIVWLLLFLFENLIIFGIFKYFFNFSFQFTYLQVCMAHFVIRMLKSDLPVDFFAQWFQHNRMNVVDKEIRKLNKELKKLGL